jgi:hypothetical protein
MWRPKSDIIEEAQRALDEARAANNDGSQEGSTPATTDEDKDDPQRDLFAVRLSRFLEKPKAGHQPHAYMFPHCLRF